MREPSYFVHARWCDGVLAPATIGSHFLASLRQLSRVGDGMRYWELGEAGVPVPLADAEQRMTQLVERNVAVDDDDIPFPEDGYGITSVGSATPGRFTGAVKVHFYARVGGKWWNWLEFRVGSFAFPAAPSLLTYPLHKGALETLAQNWPCPWAMARAPDENWNRGKKRLRFFSIAWIAYLSAPLTKGLVPPPDIVWERTPGGGMILSAVVERLDPENPEHIRRAELLEAIMNERVGGPAADPGYFNGLPPRVGSY